MIVSDKAQYLARLHHDTYQEEDKSALKASVAGWDSLSWLDQRTLIRTMQKLMNAGVIEVSDRSYKIMRALYDEADNV